MTNRSPHTPESLNEKFTTSTNKAAPIKATTIPRYTSGLMFFLYPMALKITTNTGAKSISTLALIAEVILSPLKKAVILSDTPKNAAMANFR